VRVALQEPDPPVQDRRLPLREYLEPILLNQLWS
jgi:hypothetical protein